MIRDENAVGIRLEIMLLLLFAAYIIALLIQSRREKKTLEHDNREMSYIISGMNTLFSRFALADFETGTYQYLAETKPEDDKIPVHGDYSELARHLSSIMLNEKDRQDLARFMEQNAIIEALSSQNDVRYECNISRNGCSEWEHMNIICLERKDGKACHCHARAAPCCPEVDYYRLA